MALHMLAVFGPEIAHPPTAMLSPDLLNRPSRTTFTPEECRANEAQCSYHLNRADAAASAAATAAAAASPSLPHSPADTRLLSLGKGSGFFFARGPFCSYASRNGVHALLAGEVGQWPGVDPVGVAHNAFMRGEDPPEEDDAHWLLDFYDAFRSNRALDSNENDTDGDVLQEPLDVGTSALEWLSQLRGGFAVIIYDSENHRVMTARDAAGVQSLYWGCGTGGQLLFGSSPSDLEGCAPTATAFPAGSLFVSEPRRFAFQPGEHGWVIEEGAEAPGRLLSFVRADAVSNADDVDASFAPPTSPLSPSLSMSSPRSIHAPHSGIFASPRSHGSAAAVYHDATVSHGPPPKIPRTGEEEIVIGMDSKGHPRFIPHRWRAVKAIPRINSQGVVCGAVYRVASTSDNLAAVGGGLLDDESVGLQQNSSPLRPTPSMGEVLRRQRHEAEEAAKASAAAAAAVAKAARIAAAEQAAKETMILMHNRFPNNWPEEHLRITGNTVMRITG